VESDKGGRACSGAVEKKDGSWRGVVERAVLEHAAAVRAQRAPTQLSPPRPASRVASARGAVECPALWRSMKKRKVRVKYSIFF
jgi:hypothetical protein